MTPVRVMSTAELGLSELSPQFYSSAQAFATQAVTHAQTGIQHLVVDWRTLRHHGIDTI